MSGNLMRLGAAAISTREHPSHPGPSERRFHGGGETGPGSPPGLHLLDEARAAVAELCGVLDDSDLCVDGDLSAVLGLDWMDLPVLLTRLLRRLSIGDEPAVVTRLLERALDEAEPGGSGLDGVTIRRVAHWVREDIGPEGKYGDAVCARRGPHTTD